jgi:hypothetical protein
MQEGVLVGLARQDLRDLEAESLREKLSEGPQLKRHVVAVSESQVSLGLDLDLFPGVVTALRFDLVMDLLESGQVRLS